MAYQAFKMASDPLAAVTGMLDKVGLGEVTKGLKNVVGDTGKFLSGSGNKECQQKYGSNAFWDAQGGGTCYTCPSGHKMQVLETLNSSKKCALTRCPSGYKNDPLAGKCFRCSSPYSCRVNANPVWHSEACGKCGEIFGTKKRATLKNKWVKATRKGTLKEGFEPDFYPAEDQWTKFRYLQ